VIYRSGLGDVGFFTILSCLHNLVAVDREEQSFRVVEKPNSLMALQFKNTDDANFALVETVKQCLAIDNIMFDLDATIVPKFSRTERGDRVEFAIPLLGRGGGKFVSFEFNWEYLDGYRRQWRKKQLARPSCCSIDYG
jgi:hypothetical protein